MNNCRVCQTTTNVSRNLFRVWIFLDAKQIATELGDGPRLCGTERNEPQDATDGTDGTEWRAHVQTGEKKWRGHYNETNFDRTPVISHIHIRTHRYTHR